jgi:hypothetical protein
MAVVDCLYSRLALCKEVFKNANQFEVTKIEIKTYAYIALVDTGR